jgi:quercetin dioxygenase-like cupin family protein
MKLFFVLLASIVLIGQAHADGIKRTELKRADLTGKDMDVIVTVLEVPPGEGIAKHIHPGEEAVYYLDSATVEMPDGTQRQIVPGATVINARDIPHAGFKVIGDKPLKMLNVHIVDKGKPMTEFVNK